jgi:hypothetical protein
LSRFDLRIASLSGRLLVRLGVTQRHGGIAQLTQAVIAATQNSALDLRIAEGAADIVSGTGEARQP